MEYAEENIRVFISKYKIEVILITTSLTLLTIGTIFYFKANELQKQYISKKEKTSDILIKPTKEPNKIYIDIAGSVEKPDMYELEEGMRLKDVLVMANGLSTSADREFFNRNYNLAKKVADGEKLYIPSKNEVTQGLFRNSVYIVQSENTKLPNVKGETVESKININLASLKELDTLPGVGPVTAEKIIAGRKYLDPIELLEKKIVNKGVWEKIKDLITN